MCSIGAHKVFFLHIYDQKISTNKKDQQRRFTRTVKPTTKKLVSRGKSKRRTGAKEAQVVWSDRAARCAKHRLINRPYSRMTDGLNKAAQPWPFVPAIWTLRLRRWRPVHHQRSVGQTPMSPSSSSGTMILLSASLLAWQQQASVIKGEAR